MLQTFGFRSGRGTTEILLPDLERRVISPLLKLLKAEHHQKFGKLRRNHRVHVEVLAKGTMLAQDSTHLGSAKGKKAWAEVAKDAATCEARAFGDGKVITGTAMLGHLEAMKAQGRLPLVLATDNGSAYKEQEVQSWLQDNHVIQLFSLPRTPQHNGRAERGIGEGKAVSGLGKGVQHQHPVHAVRLLNQALQTLNDLWPRTSKGGLTAAQLTQTLPSWQAMTTRRCFYEAANSAIQVRIIGLQGRKLRKETREAIFSTLERFGLIRRTIGDQHRPYAKGDRIS